MKGPATLKRTGQTHTAFPPNTMLINWTNQTPNHTTTAAAAASTPPPPMLKFYEQIIGDLLEDSSGGLVILSGGLGLFKLISYLLHLHDPSQGSLLILSASPSQKSSILRNYQDTPNLETPISTSEITFDLPAPQRLSLYGSGGIFFITARILIVDLLTYRLPTTAVAGIILLNAHSLSDTSTEAFIVRILRSSNRSLCVRAFSDRPHAMVSGFAKAERTLKCLFLRKLHLWPRFQVLWFSMKFWVYTFFFPVQSTIFQHETFTCYVVPLEIG